MFPKTQYLVLALYMVFGSLNSALADEPAYTIAPIPSWVVPVPAFGPAQPTDGELNHGYHDRLSDQQINGTEIGNTRIFSAVEFSLTNSIGVENFSEIEISFDPSYQTLSLHELTVEREDIKLSRLESTHFEVLPPELDGTRLFYNSTQSLRAKLDGLKVGDTIRYSYTVAGENPVFGGYREFQVKTELWTQLDRQHVRILSPSDKPLRRRTRGADVSLAVQDSLGIQEIIFDQRSVAEIKTENGVPSWDDAQGVLVLSDMDSWQDVVDWAQPLYQLSKFPNEDVVQIADSIKQEHSLRDEQIGAALRWVQEKIKYAGAELFVNSRLPSKPQTILTRGFADSKDKAMLTMAILRQLDINANIALVNTERGLEASDYPFRLHAFNHVIVHVESNGESHFIDPTRRGQSGALGELYEPNYGRALVLKPETVGLVAMDDSRSIVQQSVYKELTLPGDFSDLMRTSMSDDIEISDRAAGLKVTSRKQGLLAEQTRASLELKGERAVKESYIDYYQVLYPSISVADSVNSYKDAENNSTFVENYTIESFWNYNEKVGDHRWLYADEIISLLDLPEKTENRKRSYELSHPINITETWVVPVSDSVRMLLEEAAVENEWLSFSKTASINDIEQEATIVFEYATLTNEVSARDLDLYAESVEKINDQASFYLQYAPALVAANPTVAVPWNTAKVKFWVIFFAMLYFTGWSLHFMKRYRKTIDYYSDEDSAP